MGNIQRQKDVAFTEKVSKAIYANKTSDLRMLWKQLDAKVQEDIVDCIAYYVKVKSDDVVVEDRRRRGALIKGALSKQIRALKKAYKVRTAFEELECEHFGKVVALGEPFWPKEYGPLSTILSTELLRLQSLLGKVEQLFNKKRFGVAGKHYWLIFAQENFRRWSIVQRRDVLNLTPENLAHVIDAVLKVLKQQGKELTEPDNIYKALLNFRKHPQNKKFLDLIDAGFLP